MGRYISDGSYAVREIENSRIENHNTVSGNPTYTVTLEVPAANLKEILQKILGLPEQWPHLTPLDNVYAISASVATDRGAYSTDGDAEFANVVGNYLVTFNYAPRTGVYTTLAIGIDVYVDDVIEPRNESRPLNNNNFIWGNTTDTVPNDTQRTLSPSETMSKYEPGVTLTHTVEGWSFDTVNLEDSLNTCNNADYVSLVLNRTFPAGTLLLRQIQISKGFVFVSYRAPQIVSLPLIDYAGKAAPIIKFIYEYKSYGWNTFYRYDADTANYPPGYYYVRHAAAPYDKFDQFPLTDHNDWLV